MPPNRNFFLRKIANKNLKTGEIYPQYTTDGGHLTDEGYKVLTAQITPVLQALLVK